MLDVDIGMRWVDWRIFEFFKNNSWKDPTTGFPLGNRTLDSDVLKDIWKPDIFIGMKWKMFRVHYCFCALSLLLV